MLYSTERIDFISDYVSSYESKIKLLNKNGLFDAAKLFEIFAQEVCQLWFDQPFQNLNETKPNYPYVDLLSVDGNIYVQVSTAQDLPKKIRKTLEKIRDDKRKRFLDLKNVFFFVLDNESIADIQDYSGDSKIGNIEFVQNEHLITTQKIMQRATNELNFQKGLYELLYNEVNNVKATSERLIEEFENSKSVGLGNIDCFINDEYEIDRTELVNEVRNCKNQFISIRGEAGSGKSVLCKKIVENESNILYTRAERFTEETNIDNIWNIHINTALNYLNDKEIIFFIDSLEFIADAKQTKLELLQSLFEIIRKHPNAQIITSCRTSDETAFLKIDSRYNIKTFYLDSLSSSELSKIASKYPIINSFITNNSYSSLIKTPFYVNLIVKNISDASNIIDENNLRDIIWENCICLKEKYNEYAVDYSEIVDSVKSIAFNRAKSFSVGIDVSKIKHNIYLALKSEGVIIKNSSTIRLKYDIFEDICFEKEFDRMFDECKGNYIDFFNEIEKFGRCCFRRYQIWISNKILTKNNRKKFLYNLVFTKDISSEWKKQTIIGLIKSNYCDSFFEEYTFELIKENILQDFIDITNLFGFEPNLSLSDVAPIILLNPKGKGREALIKIVYENNLHLGFDVSPDSIINLCSDYSKEKTYNPNTAKMACEILQMFLSKKIDEKKIYLHNAESEFNTLLNPIYQMSEHSKSWIKEFWHTQKIALTSDNRQANEMSEEIINYTLKCTTINLAKQMPNELCELANYYWTAELIENSPFFLEKDDICYAFGLNRYAENYGKFGKHKFEYRFFPNILENNFFIALDWSIEFINQCIKYLSNQKNIQLDKESIYFVSEKLKRDYFYLDIMWFAGQMEFVLPTIISDIVYQLKERVIQIVEAGLHNNIDCSSFLNEVKNRIFIKSNSMMLFTIIEDVGIIFKDFIPGYALDLTTNINIILLDIERFVKNHPNRVQEQLEQAIYSIMGVPSIPKRYDSKHPVDYTLQDYFVQMQFVDSCKKSCNSILDYLYSITPNDSENASMHLQIQKMDFRNPVVEKVDKNTLAVSSQVTGEAKKIVDSNILQNEPKTIIENSFREFFKSFDVNNYQLESVIKLINIYFENIDNVDTPFMYDEYIVTLFAYALNKPELDSKLRDNYCNKWIDGVNSILNNGSYQFEFSLLFVLFRQVDSNASTKVKNRIKQLILDIVTYSQNNGLVSKLKKVVKYYLKENLELSNSVINTIMMLSKKPVQIKKSNTHFGRTPLKQKKDSSSKHNDSFKKVKLDKGYREKIIKKYLFDSYYFDLSKFEISNYNIQSLYHIVESGIDINNQNIKNIVKQMVLLILNKSNSNNYSHSLFENILNAKFEIFDFLGEELLINSNVVLDILFTDIDFSCFTHDAIDWYLDIFNKLLPLYVDSYKNKDKRSLCEEIVYSIEGKIEGCVKNKYVKEKLYKSLFLSVRGFEGDWSKVETDYSFKDIQFLNKMFSKYGKYDVEYFMSTIYKMKLDKLLPHILPSINIVIESVIKNTANKKASLKNVDHIVDQIITISFLSFCDEIKEDIELIDSYESILNNLISLSNPYAAVILDEFRIH